ncbi:immunity 26/phosphotriesterase HocA family protein [Methanococcus maripaludis]|uniref:Immunity protein 26 of polymorphic toxin system n=1 Tax=Methanococcus maripaludis TaxID=39152 RepID=A0A7J9PT71_METMI|nr:immunity 26/phosphotriesterase HocA family protein [Methanococcus maripaludis]MBA2868919.1 hypothetical protein [Methanococcus maripaludis]
MEKGKTKMTDELLLIKRSRKKPVVGDIFVIQPRKSVYFYGKVIEVNDQFQGFAVNNCVILIYKDKSSQLEMPDNLSQDNILIPPKIVNWRGWTSGYFYTLGNLELTGAEKDLDYGFKDSRITPPCFRKATGEKLGHEPVITGNYAIGSYGSVAYSVTKALEKNPELLEF